MKLVTYRPAGACPGPRDRAGVLVGIPRTDRGPTSPPGAGPHIIDLDLGFAWIERRAGRPHDAEYLAERYGHGVLGFIEHADEARPTADELVLAWESRVLPAAVDGRTIVQSSAGATLSAPLPCPPSLRDGYAFRAHVEAARRNRGLAMVPEFDAFPVFYFANHRSIVGPGDVYVQDAHLDRLDYELEAAIVVGRRGKNLTVAEADRAIFGMAILNDWSARALQQEEMKLSLGPAKGKDFATSLGPWLVTIDELAGRTASVEGRGMVFDLEMRASVNGRELSRGNLRDMTWTFAQILERASYGAELFPGDVLGSGTCGTGCLLELNGARTGSETSEMWLKPGDVVALEIDGLGRLENRVVMASDG